MKSSFKIFFLMATCLAGVMTAVSGQPAADKEPNQLVADGNNFISHGQKVEALWAYRQAAKAGNVEGAFAAGDLLLNQAKNGSGRERILKCYEGFQYLFFAATNHHPQACVKLSEAFKNGTGIPTNLVAAYAWLKYAGQLDHAVHLDLDGLVVRLEPGEVRQAQDMAHELQLGHWPANVAQPVEEGDSRFIVQGITVSSRGPLVVVNNETIAPGDTVEVRPANHLKSMAADKLVITCREAGSDYVLIAIAGESNLKLLSTERLARD